MSSRRSSFDGRDTYYRVDLARCGELFCEAPAPRSTRRSALAERPDAAATHGGRRRVLFLCTGNSARSQMAEALLEHRSDHTIQARSAGSHPKALHPNAVRVMAERGIDISGNTTKHLAASPAAASTTSITLCDRVREVCPEFPGQPAASTGACPTPPLRAPTTRRPTRRSSGPPTSSRCASASSSPS